MSVSAIQHESAVSTHISPPSWALSVSHPSRSFRSHPWFCHRCQILVVASLHFYIFFWGKSVIYSFNETLVFGKKKIWKGEKWKMTCVGAFVLSSLVAFLFYTYRITFVRDIFPFTFQPNPSFRYIPLDASISISYNPSYAVIRITFSYIGNKYSLLSMNFTIIAFWT